MKENALLKQEENQSSTLEERVVLSRPSVPAMDDMLGIAHPCLDHGFVRVIDYMGDDAAITQAARTSYGKGTRSTREDEGLIRYLMRHHHSTPFEMCEIKFHIKLPIFVARQWIRHRTASVNEYSARYSILDREFYIPASENLAAQSNSNRQGRGSALSGAEANEVLAILREDAERNYDHYEYMLNENSEDRSRLGLARELARMNLTLNTYTQWFWKCNLHNLFWFLQLRLDQHAQYEIRAYAEIISAIVAVWTPKAHAAFLEYRHGSANLSASMIAVLADMIDINQLSVHAAEKGIQHREINEFIGALNKSRRK